MLARKGDGMPQLSLYLDEKCMGRLRADAADAGLSLSKYVNRVINERSAAHGWPEGYWDLFGSLEGDSLVVPGELSFASDRPREW